MRPLRTLHTADRAHLVIERRRTPHLPRRLPPTLEGTGPVKRRPFEQSHTHNPNPVRHRLEILADGTIVVYDVNGTVAWHSKENNQ